MNLVFEKLTQSLAANQAWPLGIAGNEIAIAGGTYPVTVELRKNNQSIGRATGVLPGDYIRGVEFDYFEIINGSTAQEITVLISSGRAGSNRVVGEVSVISGEVVRTSSQIAFMGSGNSNALAANYSFVQLWNPLASAKNLILNQMVLTSATSGVVVGTHGTAALGAVGVNQPQNKYVGGAAAAAEIREGTAAAYSGAQFIGLMIGINTGFVFPIAEPLILVPGKGVTIWGGGVNEQVRATFQYYSEDV